VKKRKAMDEDYLQFVWKFNLYNHLNLYTHDGEEVVVIQSGFQNFNSGPDFLEAKIKIGKTLWAGNVEIHTKSSDWDKHKHQFDVAYNNVVLHVVYQHDKEIVNQNGNPIPVLVLNGIINRASLVSYEKFISNDNWITCQNKLSEIESIKKQSWLDRVLLERMEKKYLKSVNELSRTNGGWEEVFHRYLFRYFGMKVNGEAMYELACRLPLKIIVKESEALISLEALFFGQAGMLKNEMTDSYYNELREKYNFQRKKYSLVPMENAQWRFSKLRPPNFATVRIAQLAALYLTNTKFFGLIRDKVNKGQFESALKSSVSSYWQNHYVFSKTSQNVKSKVGKNLINNILINVVSPLSFTYGKSLSDYSYIDYSIDLLKESKPEDNKIIRKWKDCNATVSSSFDSQALIELYEEYCSQKKCLNCNLGMHLLSQ